VLFSRLSSCWNSLSPSLVNLSESHPHVLIVLGVYEVSSERAGDTDKWIIMAYNLDNRVALRDFIS